MDLNEETSLREAGKSHRLPGEREKWAEIKKSRAVSAMMIRGQCNWRLLGRSLPSALLSAATTKFSPSFFACWNWLTLPSCGEPGPWTAHPAAPIAQREDHSPVSNRVNQCPVVISIIKVYSILCLQAALGRYSWAVTGYVDLPLKEYASDNECAILGTGGWGGSAFCW